jgi:hypothetical protein
MISLITIQTDLVSLNEILDKTGNPTVATQILDGTYQEPILGRFNMASSPNKEGKREEYTFEGYDKWKDEVVYKSETRWSNTMKRETWNCLDSWASVLYALDLAAQHEKAEDILDLI